MSNFWGNAIGVMIVFFMFIFIAIWIWAWRKKHKTIFDGLASIPMEDNPDVDDAITTNHSIDTDINAAKKGKENES